ncbi:hypothetical protein [Aeromicrobium wangtongii]|uniref:hypothetical protein n=1 Tax=Aeromicrobium wangtongii TaxID=2969247 RepID=UPI0020171D77|nr:hypothetical protein [Aeromicrobium wangtongii]MCL3819062.1 hypothetical protein [Aeromicrobium wangtongii]
MRLSSILFSASALLIVTGTVLIVTAPSGTEGFGWFAYTPDSESISTPGWTLMSTRQLVGWSICWLASLILAVAVTHRLTRRRHRDD